MFSTVVEQAVHPITGTYKAEYIYRWMVSTFHFYTQYASTVITIKQWNSKTTLQLYLSEFDIVIEQIVLLDT